MPSARTSRVLGALESAVFLLSFGPFNSVWKSRQAAWAAGVLALCAAAALWWRPSTHAAGGPCSAPRTRDAGAVLAAVFGAAVVVSWTCHHLAMARLPADEYVNAMGSTVAWWRAGNVHFAVLYGFLPVLYGLNSRVMGRLGLHGLVAVSAAPLCLSLAVLAYQVHADPVFLAKWAAKPYVTADGLATDPNAFAMLAYFFVTILLAAAATLTGFVRRAAHACLGAALVYGIYHTSCRSALIATSVLCALVPLLVAWSNARWPSRRRLAVASVTVAVLVLAVSAVPLAATLPRGPVTGTLDRLVATYDAISAGGLAGWFRQFEYRHVAFSTGWMLISGSPWGGTGPGGYYREFSNVMFREGGWLVRPGEYVDSALNHYLMIAGDFGVGILLVNLVLLAWPALLCARRARHSVDPRERFESGVLAASLLLALPYVAAIPPSYFPEVIWIWTAIAGYAVAVCRRAGCLPSLPPAGSRTASVCLALVFVVFVAGTVSYTFGASGYSARLTARWWPAHLAYERGFHAVETLRGRQVRWTGKSTLSRVRAESGTVAFDVVDESVRPSGDAPLRLLITLNGQRVRDVTLRPREITTFEFPLSGGEGTWFVLRTEVDRTFNPRRAGVNNDTRDLGILMSPLRYPGPPAQRGAP